MSILNMITCPEVGGDTMWTSLAAAYKELSPPMKDLCDGLTALHDAHPHDRSDAMSIHPVVRVHPETGERCLYVNQHFTRRLVETSAEESEVLLRHLTRLRCQQSLHGPIPMDPRHDRHVGQPLHAAPVLNDFEGERLIQRVAVMGDTVEGVGADNGEARWPRWTGATRPGAASRFDRQLRRYLAEHEGVEPPENQHDSRD